MAVAGRTHRPIVDQTKCQRCSVCLRACPAEPWRELRTDETTTRGYVYRYTDLATRDILPPCEAACPLGQHVRDYVALCDRDALREAVSVIRQDNPLPGICGYVCHHPCETACLRASLDDAVAIRELKRAVHHYERAHPDEVIGLLRDRQVASRGREVVVVGAGPAGLGAAFTLAMAGYGVRVLDALTEPGGMLRGGIPAFRLPRDVIDHDVAMIRALGVVFAASVRMGGEVSLRSLATNGAAAVVLATGAWKDLPLGVAGEDAAGCHRCLEFLGRVNAGSLPRVSGTVVVVGGGNAAMDTARSALRVGGGRVIVAYRRSRDEMPAAEAEVVDALREGVEIRCLESPVRILVQEGRVAGVELVRMEPGDPDETGRRRPVPVAGSEFVEPADVVIPAIGQVPDVSYLHGGGSARSTLSVNESNQVAGYDNVFAAGDAVTGPSTVVEAIASGVETARRVIRRLEGEG